MGHYREDRPQAWEDRMKGVERCYATVKKINSGPFRGFTAWEKGKHIIPPSRRPYLALLRNMALNRGYKPRLGVPMEVDINHTRTVKAMVGRIIRQNNPLERRHNPHNVDMHPAFLRRPLKSPPPRPTAKTKPEWNKSPLTHGRHSPYLTSEERHRRFVNRIKCPDVPLRRVSTFLAEGVRDGTPLHITPKPFTKLVDATHRLAKRSRFDFRESVVQPKSLQTDATMVDVYSSLLSLPDGVSFYKPCPYVKKKKKNETGNTRYWFYDMDNKDLPCDLKVTPSDHAIDDPIRPGSRPPSLDPFTEPKVLYDEDMTPLDHLPSKMSSPSSFGVHGYGSLPGWAPIGPNHFLEREYECISSGASDHSLAALSRGAVIGPKANSFVEIFYQSKPGCLSRGQKSKIHVKRSHSSYDTGTSMELRRDFPFLLVRSYNKPKYAAELDLHNEKEFYKMI